jgi:ATP-dependent protease ClpP protease subunit
MARDDRSQSPPAEIKDARISLVGSVDETMAKTLRDELAKVEDGNEPLTIDMTTLGGDPEMARRMVQEIDATRERLGGRRFLFFGKSVVYSAGVTFMAAFPPEDRFLDPEAALLIHCRQSCQTIQLDGPIRAHIPKLTSLLHQFEKGIALEVANFERLIEGTEVSMDELLEKALYNWYLTADEAVERGLVAGVVRPA